MSSDDEESEETDDGLGYTLPNLPVYYSDAEESSEHDESELGGLPPETTTSAATVPPLDGRLEPPREGAFPSPTTTQTRQGATSAVRPQTYGKVSETSDALGGLPADKSGYTPPPPPPVPPHYYPPYDPQAPYAQQHHAQQGPPPPPPPPQQQYPLPYMYPPSLHDGYPAYPYHPSYYAAQRAYAEQYAAWVASAGYTIRPPPIAGGPPQLETPKGTPQMHQQKTETREPVMGVSTASQPRVIPPSSSQVAAAHSGSYAGKTQLSGFAAPVPVASNAPALVQTQMSLAEASSKVNFDSIQKVGLMLATVALMCYSSVSPRTLPLTEYNLQFYENLRIVSLAIIAPVVDMIAVFDARENDLNSVINTFFTSFTVGYTLTFIVEILATTILRLAVFCLLEPDVFSLTPRVPIPLLPWVLRENRYRPKRITLFAADFGTSCVVCPIVEEYFKLRVLQWTTRLRRYVTISTFQKNIIQTLCSHLLVPPSCVAGTSIGS
jgi:hypothetical protein